MRDTTRVRGAECVRLGDNACETDGARGEGVEQVSRKASEEEDV